MRAERDLAQEKEAKEVTPTQKKVKEALNWIVNILCVALIVFALVVAILTIVRSTNGENLTRFGKTVYMSVQSDSMEPTFKKDDIIVATYYEGDGSDLQVGQVITFKAVIGDYEGYNTHRIVCIIKNANGNVTGIKTRGDNQEGSWKDSAVYENTYDGPATGPDGSWDPRTLSLKTFDGKNMIVATWGKVDDEGNFTPGKRLKGVGAFANWLHDPEQGKTRFFCVVVLPLILLFVIYAFVLVRTLVIAKLENAKKVEGEKVVTVDSLSDEEKRRLAEEYLASLGAAQTADGDAVTEPSQEGIKGVDDAIDQEVGTTAQAQEETAEQAEEPVGEVAEEPREIVAPVETADDQNGGQE